MALLVFPKFRRISSVSDWEWETIAWTALLALALLAAFLLNPWGKSLKTAPPPLSVLSGNPVHGATLFSTLGCSSCHSLSGTGQMLRTSLAKTDSASAGNPARLVAGMWSHGTQMWEKMKDADGRWIRPSQSDMLDLLTYLYIAEYEDEPGDAARGRSLFLQKHCADCHSLSGEPGKIGPDLSLLKGDPIVWAQRMWNHRRAMQAVMKESEIPWPTFQDHEMVDLLTYIGKTASGNQRGGSEPSNLLPADPQNGKRLFREKACISCHAINGDGGKVGPDLGLQHNVPPSITLFAGLMWNHSPAMLARMDEATFARTQFAQREMADLIGYLYVVRYMEPVGSVDRGRKGFHEQHCANCHGRHGEGGKSGPRLAHEQEYLFPEMARVVGTHGPDMYRKMQEKNIAWSTLDEQQLVDLLAFLNSL